MQGEETFTLPGRETASPPPRFTDELARSLSPSPGQARRELWSSAGPLPVGLLVLGPFWRSNCVLDVLTEF